ncbi:MAG: 3-isopropylmalate dehydrogenase [Hyphomicrobiales bacterium]|nr:MAG: 3-isopropylmalate dehydrogenase [Hyphomicrobiales bacterium]
MAEPLSVLVLGGDGIGPEVVAAGVRLLEAVAAREGLRLLLEEDLLHGAAWEAHGTFCRDETVAKARTADAVLVGSVGGVQWDHCMPGGTPAQKDGLMRLRQELDVFAGLRPARAYDALIDQTPFRPELVRGADVMVVRELCGGAFFGEPRGITAMSGGGERGIDTTVYTTAEISRIARTGFELARRRRGRLVSADKANVMETYALWRRVVGEIGAAEYPDVELTHLYADNAVYQLCRQPRNFDVILGDNLFGDILSDQAGALAGSLGMLPSASLSAVPKPGSRIRPGIFEPVHGTAPDIAGQGIANPIGAILSVAMMFDYGFAMPAIARRIERAVEWALAGGLRTPDLGGSTTTAQMTDAIIAGYDPS